MPTLRPRLRAIGMLLLAATLPLQSARADDDCDAPVRQWQSREAVMQMAARQGWDVQRLKIDDGCYELRGRDASGQRFEARIDPRTLAVLRMKRRDHDRDRRDDGDRDRGHGRERDRRGDGAPPPAPGATRATIE